MPDSACEICGEPGKLVRDPFIWQIYDEDVRRVLCDNCYDTRLGDI